MHVSLGLRTVAIADGIQNRACGGPTIFWHPRGINRSVGPAPHSPHARIGAAAAAAASVTWTDGGREHADVTASREYDNNGILPIDQGSTEGYPLDTRQFIFPLGRWRCRCDIGQPIIFHATSSTVWISTSLYKFKWRALLLLVKHVRYFFSSQ